MKTVSTILAALAVWLFATLDVVGASNLKVPSRKAKKNPLPLAKNHKLTSTVTNVAARGAAESSDDTDKLIMWGDVGNFLTAALSLLLLKMTPFNVIKCPVDQEPCVALTEPPSGSSTGVAYSGPLDDCYVCDGFCISNGASVAFNSHMLSLYADILCTIPLLLLRFLRKEELQSLGLDDYYLSSLKVNSVAGHGIAHMFLSYLTLNKLPTEWLTGIKPQRIVTIALALSRFANKNTLDQIKGRLDQLRGKYYDAKALVEEAKTSRNVNVFRNTVTPALTGLSLAQMVESPPADKPGPLNYLVFGLTSYVFYEAGLPPEKNNWLFAALMTAITTYITVGVLKVENVQQSFVIVFTGAYLVAAMYQLLFWDKEKKRENPRPYALTAWTSNLFTTLVGWLIGLKCSNLKQYGGHVLYDLSIPFSYFAIYMLTKNG